MEKSGESSDVLRGVAAYLLGAMVTSTQKMREAVEHLVKEGELTRQQGEKLLGEIEAKLSSGAKGVGKCGRSGAAKVMGAVGFATGAQLAKLEKRVTALEERLGVASGEVDAQESGGPEEG